MPLGIFVCQSCHERVHGRPKRSYSGRAVCENCLASQQAVTVATAMGQDLPETIATVGWLQRVRAARGKRGWPGEGR